MAIFSANHRPIGKTTQKQVGTAGAHVRYITRAGAASLVMAEHMPAAPDAARAWFDEREGADRKNGRVADKLMLALPVELDGAQRADLVRDFMQQIGGGRVSWMAGIHDRGADANNPHAHVILRDKDFESGRRVYGTSEKGSTERIREAWEIAANDALARAGLDVRIDRRSLEAQGLDREAGIHVGANVYAMEDRGIRPVSVAQEVANDRVVNWPEIDQGRTRADRQREIEAGNLQRDRDRGRDTSGDISAGLAPVVEIAPQLVPPAEVEPEPVAYVPNFVLVADAPRMATPESRMASAFMGEEPARKPQEPVPVLPREVDRETVQTPQRVSYEVVPQPVELGRWAGIVAAARERLVDLAARLDMAFGRVRDRALKPEPDRRPTPPPEKKGRDVDNGAVILEAMKPPTTPEPKRARSVAEELLEAGRRHREQNPKPDLDRDLGMRRRRMPWEPPL